MDNTCVSPTKNIVDISSDDEIESPPNHYGIKTEGDSLFSASKSSSENHQRSSAIEQDRTTENGVQGVIREVAQMGVVQVSNCDADRLLSEITDIGKCYTGEKTFLKNFVHESLMSFFVIESYGRAGNMGSERYYNYMLRRRHKASGDHANNR